MKQKLKEKINVGDKVKKPSFQKCVKMSKEFENLKNGVLNGDSVISNNHTQQQQQKLNNNSNVDREAAAATKAIVGGRLQFYKGNSLSLYSLSLASLNLHLLCDDFKKKIFILFFHFFLSVCAVCMCLFRSLTLSLFSPFYVRML